MEKAMANPRTVVRINSINISTFPVIL